MAATDSGAGAWPQFPFEDGHYEVIVVSCVYQPAGFAACEYARVH